MTTHPKKWRPAFVTVTAGAVLALSGCRTQPPPPMETTHNPPMPTVTDAPDPVGNPPAQLPSWDSVASGHPEGATNPPSALLQLITDGSCHKQWHAGMLKYPPDTKSMQLGEHSYSVRFLTTPDDSRGRTIPIQCPPDADKALEANKDKAITPQTPAR